MTLKSVEIVDAEPKPAAKGAKEAPKKQLESIIKNPG